MRRDSHFEYQRNWIIWAVVAGFSVLTCLFLLVGFSQLVGLLVIIGVIASIIGFLEGIALVYLLAPRLPRSAPLNRSSSIIWIAGLILLCIIGLATFSYSIYTVPKILPQIFAMGFGFGVATQAASKTRMLLIH